MRSLPLMAFAQTPLVGDAYEQPSYPFINPS